MKTLGTFSNGESGKISTIEKENAEFQKKLGLALEKETDPTKRAFVQARILAIWREDQSAASKALTYYCIYGYERFKIEHARIEKSTPSSPIEAVNKDDDKETTIQKGVHARVMVTSTLPSAATHFAAAAKALKGSK